MRLATTANLHSHTASPTAHTQLPGAVRSGVLFVWLCNVIHDAVCYAAHAQRKTVMALDVVHALRRQNRVIYGFGH